MRKDDILIDELIRKVDRLELNFNAHTKDEHAKYAAMIEATTANAKAVAELSRHLEKVSTNTEGLVEAWQAATTVGKIIGWLSKAAKVVAPLGFIGVALSYVAKKMGWW